VVGPEKLPRSTVITAAAFIWIVIKLPQEYWIHIAQMDATDFIKVNILGGTLESPWSQVLADSLLQVVLLAGVSWPRPSTCSSGGCGWPCPMPDHGLIFASNKYMVRPDGERMHLARLAWQAKIFDRDLLEKFVLMALLTLIFSNILPNATSSSLQIMVQVGIFVTINTAVSHFLARRGTTFASGVTHFLVVLALNTGIVLAIALLPGGITNWLNSIFFVLLLSLLVTMFDRFQPVHMARFLRM
jgi:hypothetical protein